MVSRSSRADIQSVNTEEVVWLLGYCDNLWINLKMFLSQSCLRHLTCSSTGAISELLCSVSAKTQLLSHAFCSLLPSAVRLLWGNEHQAMQQSALCTLCWQIMLSIKWHVIRQRIACYIKMAVPEEKWNFVELLIYIGGGLCRTYFPPRPWVKVQMSSEQG